MGLAAATLATLLGGGSGRVTWPSAAGGEDEELPDKTPGGGDSAGRPTTASAGCGVGGGGGGGAAGFGGEVGEEMVSRGTKRGHRGRVTAREKKKEAWFATQCTKDYPS